MLGGDRAVEATRQLELETRAEPAHRGRRRSAGYELAAADPDERGLLALELGDPIARASELELQRGDPRLVRVAVVAIGHRGVECMLSTPRMSLVVLDDVTLFFADRMIFDAVSLRLGHGDRIGLIGPNGSGKTTLLKIIASEQEIDDGKVTRANGVRIGWLPQDLAIGGGQSLIEMILSSVPGRVELDERLAAAEGELEEATRQGVEEGVLLDLAGDVGELHERIDHFERFFGEHEALAILAGLGFGPGDETRDLGELSGGWKMRGVLAGLLFQRPDVLLLDEPTNHLDLPSVAWFSDFLKRWYR